MATLSVVALGVILRLAECEVPPKRPEMVAAVAAELEMVVTPNVALMAPAGTVTLNGTLALGLLLLSDTAAPPDGDGPLGVAGPRCRGLPG
jgi:hypothetical protein